MDFGKKSFGILKNLAIFTFGTGHNLPIDGECNYWSRTRSALGQNLAFVV